MHPLHIIPTKVMALQVRAGLVWINGKASKICKSTSSTFHVTYVLRPSGGIPIRESFWKDALLSMFLKTLPMKSQTSSRPFKRPQKKHSWILGSSSPFCYKNLMAVYVFTPQLALMGQSAIPDHTRIMMEIIPAISLATVAPTKSSRYTLT